MNVSDFARKSPKGFMEELSFRIAQGKRWVSIGFYEAVDKRRTKQGKSTIKPSLNSSTNYKENKKRSTTKKN